MRYTQTKIFWHWKLFYLFFFINIILMNRTTLYACRYGSETVYIMYYRVVLRSVGYVRAVFFDGLYVCFWFWVYDRVIDLSRWNRTENTTRKHRVRGGRCSSHGLIGGLERRVTGGGGWHRFWCLLTWKNREYRRIYSFSDRLGSRDKLFEPIRRSFSDRQIKNRTRARHNFTRRYNLMFCY